MHDSGLKAELEKYKPCKRHYWNKWQNFNIDSELNNGIVSVLNFLIVIILPWIYKEKS